MLYYDLTECPDLEFHLYTDQQLQDMIDAELTAKVQHKTAGTGGRSGFSQFTEAD